MLEKLLTFLADNGIEVPDGTDADGAMAIIQSLLNAEGGTGDGSGEDGADGDADKDTTAKAENPTGMGVA